jgi:hypothetical protein
MKCRMVATDERNGNRVKHVCKRDCGKVLWVPDGPGIRDPGECKGKLLLSDWREAITAIMEGLGLDKAAAIVWWVRWRAKGSPLDSLPPGIPAPHLVPLPAGLSDAEVSELFPGEDPTLIGNRIKAMTEAIGIPSCNGCEVRREWLNRCHAWLRS